MIRNLKILGVALAAAFALSAVAASAALAVEEQAFLTSDGPVTLTGTETGGGANNRLTAFGTFTECPGTTYTGHKYNVTPHEFLEAHSTTVTITPNYVNCVSSALKLKTTVDMNGCDYVFHLGKTTSPSDVAPITATVVCPAGKHIEVTIPGIACTITITENAAGYAGLSVTDTTQGAGKNDVDITGTINTIEADSNAGCPVPNATTKTASLIQDVTVVGHNKALGFTEIGLSDEKESTSTI